MVNENDSRTATTRPAMRPAEPVEIEMIGNLTMVEAIARVCHEANRAYCVALGDHSQGPWDEAPEWQRASARAGVRAHLSVPDGLDPRASHEAWLRDKIAGGWRYGAAKDVEQRLHPCCVPYDELPDEQKLKDALFGAIVKALRNVYTHTVGAWAGTPLVNGAGQAGASLVTDGWTVK